MMVRVDSGLAEDTGEAERDRTGVHDRVHRWLAATRVVMLVPTVVLILTSVVTVTWATVKVVEFVLGLFHGSSDSSLLAELLDAIDLYLIGTVLVVLGFGLYEAFWRPSGRPDELVRADVLTALEVKVADVLVVVLAIRFAEQLLTGVAARDLLLTAAAIGIISLALVLFARFSSTK
jgi:uncharacterized membrane protein YqhA